MKVPAFSENKLELVDGYCVSAAYDLLDPAFPLINRVESSWTEVIEDIKGVGGLHNRILVRLDH